MEGRGRSFLSLNSKITAVPVIHKTSFTGTTSANGNLIILNSSGDETLIAVSCQKNETNGAAYVAIPYIYTGAQTAYGKVLGIHVMTDADGMPTVKSTSVKGVCYWVKYSEVNA